MVSSISNDVTCTEGITSRQKLLQAIRKQSITGRLMYRCGKDYPRTVSGVLYCIKRMPLPPDLGTKIKLKLLDIKENAEYKNDSYDKK